MKVEDGSGKGYAAGVSSDNRLEVASISGSIEHHINHQHGEAYSLLFSQSPTANDDCILYIENNNPVDMVFEGMCLYVSAACEVSIQLNAKGTRNSVTSLTPANLNAGSGKSAVGTFERGADLDGGAATLAGGTEVFMHKYIAETATESINFEQDIIVPRFDTLTMWCSSSAATITGTMLFNYHSEEG